MYCCSGKSSRSLIGPGRDTHPPEQEPKVWKDYVALGAQQQQWIGHPHTPCKIQRSHLTMQDIHDQGWYISKRASEALNWLDFHELKSLGLPCDPANLTRNFDVYRYVFIKNVMNEQTIRLIMDLLYSSERHAPWPGKYGQRDVWEWNTPEYQALLGTRLEKIVAYLILGSFERGTKKIARVVTYRIGNAPWPQMRFDIEDTM